MRVGPGPVRTRARLDLDGSSAADFALATILGPEHAGDAGRIRCPADAPCRRPRDHAGPRRGAGGCTRDHLAGAATAPAAAAHHSLYDGPGPRPGPAILYDAPATAPQLTNVSPWQAPPILVSGTSAYRDHEFLYRTFSTTTTERARSRIRTILAPPTGPISSRSRTAPTPIRPEPGTTTTPPISSSSGSRRCPGHGLPGHAEHARQPAADRVLDRDRRPTRTRVPVSRRGQRGGTGGAVPDRPSLRLAPGRQPRARRPRQARSRPAPTVAVDLHRRQITVEIPHADWNPARATVRFAMGVGLWNRARGRYLLPGAAPPPRAPGGAGSDRHPAAFFNVAFRTQEPLPGHRPARSSWSTRVVARSRPGHRARARATSRGSSPMSASPSWPRASGTTRRCRGPDRSIGSWPATSRSPRARSSLIDAGSAAPTRPCACRVRGQASSPTRSTCRPASRASRGYGLTLLLHSASANYNQYLGSRIRPQFADRADPLDRDHARGSGPDLQYEGSAPPTCSRHGPTSRALPPRPHLQRHHGLFDGRDRTPSGSAAQFPDLFARAQPTVGEESNNDVLASLRNVPVLMWNNSGDELVDAGGVRAATRGLAPRLGYRFQLDVYPALQAHRQCSRVLPDHLELAINDQFAPAADVLGRAGSIRTPRTSPTSSTAPDRPSLRPGRRPRLLAVGLTLRDATARPRQRRSGRKIDAVSHGFGIGRPDPSGPCAQGQLDRRQPRHARFRELPPRPGVRLRDRRRTTSITSTRPTSRRPRST